MILLPPSEGKAADGSGPPWRPGAGAFPELDGARRAVRDAVRRVLGGGDAAAAQLLGVRGRHLAEAMWQWQELERSPTMPACLRYRGVVPGALAPEGLGGAARRALERRGLVPSGLWGIASATDPIPAYRLRMAARVDPLGVLAAFWRPRITPLVARRADGGWIIDMLPREHAAAIDAGALGAERSLTIELIEGEGESRRLVGHEGKSLKGRLARAIIEADARTPRAVAALDVPGLRVEDASAGPGGVTIVLARVPMAPPPSNMLGA